MFTWLWHWLVVPFFVMPFLVFPIFLAVTLIAEALIRKPILGFILHVVAFGWIFFNTDNVLYGFGVPYLSIIVYALLFVAAIDCFIEMLFNIKYVNCNRSVLLAKEGLMVGVAFILSYIFHFAVPSDQRGLFNVTNNYFTILVIAATLPRLVSVILEIRAVIVEKPKVLQAIKSNAFFGAFLNPYFEKYADIEVLKGNAVSNDKTREHERKISESKLKTKHPKLNDEKLQEKINQLKKEQKYETSVSFISTAGYENFCKEAENALKQSGTFSPRTFVAKKFPQEKGRLSLGIEFFTIMAFTPGVEEGRISDENLDDSSIFVNHTYRHNESVKKMVSREIVL